MRIGCCASYTLSLTNLTNKVSYATVYCLQSVYSFLYVYVRLISLCHHIPKFAVNKSGYIYVYLESFLKIDIRCLPAKGSPGCAVTNSVLPRIKKDSRPMKLKLLCSKDLT